MHTMFVFPSCAAIVDWSDSDFSEEESDVLAVPNRHNRRVCNEEALQLSLGSGRTLSSWELKDHRILWIRA